MQALGCLQWPEGGVPWRLAPSSAPWPSRYRAAAPGQTISSRRTWAKVNICNPTQLGARAQLAGDGSSDRMQVRFTAQWLSPDGWVPLAGQATSPWQDAGSAEFTWQQAGWTFALNVPQNGAGLPAARRRGDAARLGPDGAATTGTCTVGG